MPSKRLLPGRSGMTRCLASSTCTKPGASPLGETSQRPLEFAVAISTNGDEAMNAWQCASSSACSFNRARSIGTPNNSRSSLIDVTTFLNTVAPFAADTDVRRIAL